MGMPVVPWEMGIFVRSMDGYGRLSAVVPY